MFQFHDGRTVPLTACGTYVKQRPSSVRAGEALDVTRPDRRMLSHLGPALDLIAQRAILLDIYLAGGESVIESIDWRPGRTRPDRNHGITTSAISTHIANIIGIIKSHVQPPYQYIIANPPVALSGLCVASAAEHYGRKSLFGVTGRAGNRRYS